MLLRRIKNTRGLQKKNGKNKNKEAARKLERDCSRRTQIILKKEKEKRKPTSDYLIFKKNR